MSRALAHLPIQSAKESAAESGSWGRTRERRLRVGFLTYDLQRNTEDLVFEVARSALFAVKAFPLFEHDDQKLARVPFRAAAGKAKYLGVNVKGSTPEGLMFNPELAVGLACAWQSDIIVLKGLFGLGAIWCTLCARLMGRMVISTNQTLPVKWERKRRWWLKLLKRVLLRMCHYHIYQNPAAIEVLTEVYRCAPESLISAPFEGGAALFKRILLQTSTGQELRRESGFDDRVIFLYAGNLHPFKGVADIIRAASLMQDDGSFLCVFIGPEEPANKDGATVESFTGLACAAGVNHLTRFLAPVGPEKLAELYRAADVLLLPTRRDMFPKVLVEAGLAGKPLVTTSACGSAGVIVQDGVNGFVIEPEKPLQLAGVMTKLLDQALRLRMGAESRRIVDQHCNIELEVQGYVTAIKRASGCILTKQTI
jgi:glycosyltransferase involved in cell wall biosynthesis